MKPQSSFKQSSENEARLKQIYQQSFGQQTDQVVNLVNVKF